MALPTQPSAQGIASLYMGNPQKLQQNIQQEQKANPGILPDLQKMLALQIALKTNKSATDMKAMEQLKQMGGQTGQMPTVMDQLEQQAQQKMQAQAQSAQPAQAGAGIDQIPVEFTAAEGGIVAFSGGGASMSEVTREVLKELGESGSAYVNDPEVKQTVDKLVRERVGAAGAAEGAAAEGAAAEGAAANVAKGLAATPEAAQAGRLYKLSKLAGKTVAKTGPAAIGAEVVSNMGDYKFDKPDKIDTSLSGTVSDLSKGEFGRAGKGLMRGLAEAGMDLGSTAANLADYVVPGKAPVSRAYEKLLTSNIDDLRGPSSDKKAAAAEAKKPQVVTQGTPTSYGPGDKVVPRWSPEKAAKEEEKPTPEVAEIDKMLASLQKAPAAGGAPRPSAGLPSAPALKTDPRLEKLMNIDPEAEKKKAMEDMAKHAPDDTWTNKLMAEYEKRKKELEPKQGYEGLMEYLGQVSRNSRRGMGAFGAGAAGAVALDDLNKERKQQQFEFTKQMMELGQKRDEAKRLFELETKKVGREVYDKAYTQLLQAFQEKGQNDRQASANATQLSVAAMQVAETARGHTLTAQAQLMQLKLAEKRGDRDNAALQLKSLSETASTLSKLLENPVYAQSEEGKRDRNMMQAINREVAKRGGIDLGQTGFSSKPANPVAGKLS